MTRQSIDKVLDRAASMDAESRNSAIEVAGARIHFKLSGPAGKPVLVFSNSLGADLSMWNAQAEEFSKYFRILRYDTRREGDLKVGDLAPSVVLHEVETGAPTRILERPPDRPVILVFGSFT